MIWSECSIWVNSDSEISINNHGSLESGWVAVVFKVPEASSLLKGISHTLPELYLLLKRCCYFHEHLIAILAMIGGLFVGRLAHENKVLSSIPSDFSPVAIWLFLFGHMRAAWVCQTAADVGAPVQTQSGSQCCRLQCTWTVFLNHLHINIYAIWPLL